MNIFQNALNPLNYNKIVEYAERFQSQFSLSIMWGET